MAYFNDALTYDLLLSLNTKWNLNSIITRLLNKTCRPWFKSSKDIYQNLISSSCLWVSKIPFFKLQFLWFLLDKTAEKTNEINQTTMYHGGLKLYQSLLITFLKLISKTLKAVLKYGFCNKSFRKDEPLTSWTLLQHICPHFWAWLLNTIAITPKSEDKYVEKVFNWSEVHFSEMTCYKIHILRGFFPLIFHF